MRARLPLHGRPCPLSTSERALLAARMEEYVRMFWTLATMDDAGRMRAAALLGLATARASKVPPYAEMRRVLDQEDSHWVRIWVDGLCRTLTTHEHVDYLLMRLGLRATGGQVPQLLRAAPVGAPTAMNERELRAAIEREVMRVAGAPGPIAETYRDGVYSVSGPNDSWFCVCAATGRAPLAMLEFLIDLPSKA